MAKNKSAKKRSPRHELQSTAQQFAIGLLALAIMSVGILVVVYAFIYIACMIGRDCI